MKKHWRSITLILLVLIILSPVLYNHSLLYFSSPDIQYVMAKVNWVADGDIYTDPVTGYPNFHPPIYHFILSFILLTGVGIETLLWLISIFNVCLIFLLTYLIAKRLFGQETAFYTLLILPFIFYNMGFGRPFLATSFTFSIPLYLLGLWIYLADSPSLWKNAAVSAIWGLAFLISPVYFFLIGLTFVCLLFIKRDYRSFGIMLVVFVIVIIPFIIQARVVHAANMDDTATFALWREIPDATWFGNFFLSLLSPFENKGFSLPALINLSILAAGIIGALRSGPVNPILIVAVIAYLLTAYHFSMQYAVRIQFFVSILMAGYAVRLVRGWTRYRIISLVVILLVAGYSTFDLLKRTTDTYSTRVEHYKFWKSTGAGLKINLGRFINKGDYVLATDHTYRYFIMPFFMVHGMVAYKSGEYYQLDSELSKKMLADYNSFLESENINEIEKLCDAYNVYTCVGRLEEYLALKGFETIARNWRLVYENNYFRIYQR